MRIRKGLLRGGLLLVCLGLSAPVLAEEPPKFATLFSSQGSVEVKRGSAWQDIASGAAVIQGDSVRTGTGSRAAFSLPGEIFVRLGADSAVEFQRPSDPNSAASAVRINYGTAYFFSRTEGNFPTVDTPFVSAAVRGTEFVVEVSKTEARVAVLEGKVLCRNDFGQAVLKRGEEARTRAGEAPRKTLLIKPEDAVEWSVYIPAVFDASDFKSAAPTRENSEIIGLLESAAQRLGAGEIEKARGDLHRARAVNARAGKSADRPRFESAIGALEAMIDLARNDKDGAKAKALLARRESSTAASAAALSYAYQSRFDLDAAQREIASALEQDPSNPRLLARSAELSLGRGDLDAAFETAARAAELSPSDAYIQSVLGFALLVRNETAAAQAAFEKAAAAQGGSGLPHLGLGLAYIKNGELARGRAEIQQAVLLEPSIALYRSYLGKSYFEERKEDFAAREYSRAIDLDPLDPTPFLYRSYYQLSRNRPVQALYDLETSYKLNDNRAVYRSNFLLDQDYAARSAGLAEVYQTLGFSEAARIEAIKSLSEDYSNYAAHLFLGGVAADERIFDVRDAEYTIANLLAPINVNALRQTSGSAPSFNEYTSLFDRLQTRTTAFGQWRSSLDEAIADLTHIQTFENAGVLARFATIDGGGSKDGDYERQNLFQLEGQYYLSPSDRVFARSSFTATDEREIEEQLSSGGSDLFAAALGYHHTFSSRAHFVSQLDFKNAHDHGKLDPRFRAPDVIVFPDGSPEPFIFNDEGLLIDENVRRQRQGFRYLAQFIQEAEPLSLIAGARLSAFHTSLHEESPVVLDDFTDPFLLEGQRLMSDASDSQNSYEFYAYSTAEPVSWLKLTGGLNFAEAELGADDPLFVEPPFLDGTRHKNLLSPKAGLVASLTDETTLRAAWFKRLGLPDVDNRVTIEPTLVGGLNQVYDDPAGVESENYGAGLDHKFSKKTYLGVEALRRRLKDDVVSVDSLLTAETAGEDVSLISQDYAGTSLGGSADEDLMRAYGYQVLSSDFTASAEYALSALDDDRARIAEDELTTNRLILAVNYFDRGGMFARLSGTWRQQDADSGSEEDAGEISDFWLFDAAVGYRLPKRYGSLQLSLRNLLDRDFSYRTLPSDGRRLSDDFEALLSFNLDF